jgi:hypothetical protein
MFSHIFDKSPLFRLPEMYFLQALDTGHNGRNNRREPVIFEPFSLLAVIFGIQVVFPGLQFLLLLGPEFTPHSLRESDDSWTWYLIRDFADTKPVPVEPENGRIVHILLTPGQSGLEFKSFPCFTQCFGDLRQNVILGFGVTVKEDIPPIFEPASDEWKRRHLQKPHDLNLRVLVLNLRDVPKIELSKTNVRIAIFGLLMP